MGEIRIYTDESVDVTIAQGLQKWGIEAFSARDSDKLGLTNEAQLIFAGDEKKEFEVLAAGVNLCRFD